MSRKINYIVTALFLAAAGFYFMGSDEVSPPSPGEERHNVTIFGGEVFLKSPTGVVSGMLRASGNAVSAEQITMLLTQQFQMLSGAPAGLTVHWRQPVLFVFYSGRSGAVPSVLFSGRVSGNVRREWQQRGFYLAQEGELNFVCQADTSATDSVRAFARYRELQSDSTVADIQFSFNNGITRPSANSSGLAMLAMLAGQAKMDHRRLPVPSSENHILTSAWLLPLAAFLETIFDGTQLVSGAVSLPSNTVRINVKLTPRKNSALQTLFPLAADTAVGEMATYVFSDSGIYVRFSGDQSSLESLLATVREKLQRIGRMEIAKFLTRAGLEEDREHKTVRQTSTSAFGVGLQFKYVGVEPVANSDIGANPRHRIIRGTLTPEENHLVLDLNAAFRTEYPDVQPAQTAVAQ